jgi:hypothetical protein
VYGYPGDGINGILGGFHELSDRIEFVQAAHLASDGAWGWAAVSQFGYGTHCRLGTCPRNHKIPL